MTPRGAIFHFFLQAGFNKPVLISGGHRERLNLHDPIIEESPYIVLFSKLASNHALLASQRYLMIFYTVSLALHLLIDFILI